MYVRHFLSKFLGFCNTFKIYFKNPEHVLPGGKKALSDLSCNLFYSIFDRTIATLNVITGKKTYQNVSKSNIILNISLVAVKVSRLNNLWDNFFECFKIEWIFINDIVPCTKSLWVHVNMMWLVAHITFKQVLGRKTSRLVVRFTPTLSPTCV
jgi:hypothetical protein